jgi:alkaline phosphatase
MKTNKLFCIIITLCLAFVGCEKTPPVSDDFSFYTPSENQTPFPLVPEGPVENVILMIGDGMGITHIAATRTIVLGARGRLAIERLPVTGIIDHYSTDEFVSGSAATATSLATGYKTIAGMIAMLPDGTPALTILEAARARGMATGLVATSTITHATPAAFAAHIHDRDLETEIAVQLIESKVNVLFGGGRALFKPELSGYKFRRTDGRDLITEARRAGYDYMETREALMEAKPQSDYLLGLFCDGYLLNRETEPKLAEMTDKALEILSRNESGFFLMVEGSQIDWGAEENDLNYTIRELLHFDLAVQRAIHFSIDDKKTLLVVTADHETGGMFISNEPPNNPDGRINIRWGTDEHTGAPVAVFAYGPYAERFMGWYDNTEIPKKIANILGITDFPRKIFAE